MRKFLLISAAFLFVVLNALTILKSSKTVEAAVGTLNLNSATGTSVIGGNSIQTVTRTTGTAINDWIDIGNLAANDGIYGQLSIKFSGGGEIGYTKYTMNFNGHSNDTTSWIELPPEGGVNYTSTQTYAVDARHNGWTNPINLRLRKIGNAGSASTVTVRIETNATFTATSTSGSNGSVASGYLGSNLGWKFPVMTTNFDNTTNGLFVTSDGDVGIGTTNPSPDLDIVDSSGEVTVAVGDDGTKALRFIWDNSVDKGVIDSYYSAAHHDIRVGSSTTFEASGEVGIGTTAPGQSLDVQGGSINTSANLMTGGTARITSGGNLTNIGTFNGATALTSSNYNSYAPTLTGTGASGSWNINAATVTNGVYTSTALRFPLTTWMYASGAGVRNFYIGASDMYFEIGGAGSFHFRNSADADVMTISSAGNIAAGNFSGGTVAVSGDPLTAIGGQAVSLGVNGYASLGSLRIKGTDTTNTIYSEQTKIGITAQNASGVITFNTGTSGTERMRITQTGRVGVGITSPNYDFDWESAQSGTYIAHFKNTNTSNTADVLLLDLGVANGSRGTGNYFVGFAGAGTVAGKIQGGASAVAYTTTAADYAEYFAIENMNDKPKAGEIVTVGLSKNQSTTKALSDSYPIGIVSTNPGFIGNGPICKVKDDTCDADYEKTNVLVGLTGQVKTKVTTVNGAIHKGDLITVSKTPGVGMKSTEYGYVVGRALEDYSNENTSEIGSIMVFVQPAKNDMGTNLEKKLESQQEQIDELKKEIKALKSR